MKPSYEFGTEVRVVRTIRNDGTFPGKRRGEQLVRRGSVGFVREFGVFLQDQMIYQVHFLDLDITVGCREQELVLASEPWVENEFEFGYFIHAACPLALRGEVAIDQGQSGQILAVVREPTHVNYEVLFGERLLLVPESALRWPCSPMPLQPLVPELEAAC